MMVPDTRKAPSAKGASLNIEIAGQQFDFQQFSPNLPSLQAAAIRRRFNLSDELANAIAVLVFGRAA